MAEPQPRTVHEGATTATDGIEEEVTKAKSAEDRKAAAALASMDSGADEGSAEVDAAAVSKAMKNLGAAAPAEKKEVKKVKVDAADVALLVSSSLPIYYLVSLSRLPLDGLVCRSLGWDGMPREM
jgi:hypothetical protein